MVGPEGVIGLSTTDAESSSNHQHRRTWRVISPALLLMLALGSSSMFLLGCSDPDPDPHEANAARIAEAMLAQFPPPDGATPVSETPELDSLTEGPGLDRQVERVKRWRLPGDAMAVAKAIAADPPSGYAVQSNTPMKTGSGIIYVWLHPESRPGATLQKQGIGSRALALSLADADGDTVELLAQATVNWAATRGADSKIPTDVTRLTIVHRPAEEPPSAPWGRPTTVTDRTDIDRLVAMFNTLDPGPESTDTLDCVGDPATSFGTYRLSFDAAGEGNVATAVVDTLGCKIVRLTVDGEDKGNFWGTGALSTAVHRLHSDHS